jgi:hypothetical protein
MAVPRCGITVWSESLRNTVIGIERLWRGVVAGGHLVFRQKDGSDAAFSYTPLLHTSDISNEAPPLPCGHFLLHRP